MKCAFGPCTCPKDDVDDYCAPTCRMEIGDADEKCKCGHEACTATTGTANLTH